MLNLIKSSAIVFFLLMAPLQLNALEDNADPVNTNDIDCTEAKAIAEGLKNVNGSAIDWGRYSDINDIQALLARFKAGSKDNTINIIIDAQLLHDLSKNPDLPELKITNSIIKGKFDFNADAASKLRDTNTKMGENIPIEAIGHKISFKGTIFLGEANFSGVEFLEGADFSNTKFCDRAIFSRTGFFKSANFKDSKFYKEAGFYDAMFGEFSDITFNGATFFTNADFSFTTFGQGKPSRKILHNKIRIDPGKCDYSIDNKKKYTKFIQTKFVGDVNFKSSLFNNEAFFNESMFDSTADFNKAKFCLNADFRATEFQKPVYFKQADFCGKLIIKDALFKEYIDLRFSNIMTLNFKNDNIPNFISAVFDLRNSEIWEAHFEDIVFEDDVNFFKTKFGREDNRPGGIDNKEPVGVHAKCNLKNSENIIPATVFRDINFESDAVFLKTDFCGRAAFEKVNFEKSGNFIDVDFKCADYRKNTDEKYFSLSYLTFSEFNFRLNRIPDLINWVDSDKGRIVTAYDKSDLKKDNSNIDLQRLSEVFEDFESTFKQHERFEDQILASRHMKSQRFKEMLTGASKKSFPGKHLSILSSGEFWIYVFWGWNSQYGTNLKRMLFTCVFFFFFFSLAYFAAPRIRTVKVHEGSVFRLIEVPGKYFTKGQPDSDQDSTDSVRNLIDSMQFSMILLFKIGHANIEVSDNLSIKFIAWIEWLMGYWFLLILALTLLNTVPIINTIAGALL